MPTRDRLLVIVGPTAVGKTALSLQIAQDFAGEIISGDSMQVYRGMDIGTAKATKEERALVPHHLIDIKDPDEDFSVAEFQSLVRPLIREINERGHLPILVGGTGLYIQSVTHGYHFPEASQDEAFRREMHALAEREGNEALHNRLLAIDPETAARLHPNDRKRIIRALEIYHVTGKRMSELQKKEREPRYDLLMIGLTMERQKLYERINERVEQMIDQGLIDEVKSLLARGYGPHLTSMQALGYKELIPYLEGRITKEEAIETIKKRTRNFAKRQLSWFRRLREIQWFDLTETASRDKIRERIYQTIAGKFR
ncbi:tRNA (adenosine(37)-N6)-dimethylallyltransferase MiaA [Bacillaceae bacterium]